MEWADSHTHLYDENYEHGGDDAVLRAIEAGVTTMILPGTQLPEFAPMKALAARFPQYLHMAIGVHPSEVTESPDEVIATVKAELEDKSLKYIGVGEIGIDLYCPGPPRETQMRAFDAQCRLALEHDLPIIIHCRDGLDETLEVLQGLPIMPQGVFHCFGGNEADVERIRKTGDFYFGINGIVTFKNSNLRDTLPAIGIDRIALETDAPYLSPVPYRGKRNESAYIPLIGAEVAKSLGLPIEMVAERTTSNTRKLFGI